MKKICLIFAILVFMGNVLVAQERRITGTVTDAVDGSTMPGVTISVQGTTQGTITDTNGRYEILVAEGSTLVYSFIGMVTERRIVGTESVINVSLSMDLATLQEIVVVGYGVQRKREVTGSISSVSGEDLARVAAPSFDTQLAGRAAGVQVATGSGVLGEAPNINIRGVGSITSGTQPLIVVDGVPIISGDVGRYAAANALGDINPQDIESIEILKDGSATAIYGSRAANGVILITTKRGKVGALQVNYNNYFGIAQPVNLFDLTNETQWLTLTEEMFVNAGAANPTVATGLNTDWQRAVLRTAAFQQDHNISLSGATEQTNYFFSMGYTNQEGVTRPNAMERFTFRSNLDQKFLNNKVTVGANANLSRAQYNGLNTGENSLSGNVFNAIRQLPNTPIYNADHPTGYNIDEIAVNLVGRGANTRGIDDNLPNIRYVIDHNMNNSKVSRATISTFGMIEFLPTLFFRTQLAADIAMSEGHMYWDPFHGDGASVNGRIYNTMDNYNRWNVQNVLTYMETFADVHSINLTLVSEVQKQRYNYFFSGGTDLSDVFFRHNVIGGSYGTQLSTGSMSENGIISYAGRFNYNYDDRFFFQFSSRYDGLSALPEVNKWGFFPGASVGWTLSREAFMQNVDWLSDLKIRASYAEVGNSSIGNYPYLGLYSGVRYADYTGIGFTQMGNDQLKWETSKKWDIGVDATLFEGRYIFTYDFFLDDQDGLILDVPTPPSMGIPGNRYAANIGSLRNQGHEFSVTANLIRNVGFTWAVDANLTFVRNEINTLVDDQPITLDYTIIDIGESIRSVYGFDYVGVNPANGNPIYRKGDGTYVQGNIATQNYRVYDPNNPGDISQPGVLSAADDKIVFGPSLPTYYGAINNRITWGNFDFSAMIRYSGGNFLMNRTRADLTANSYTNFGSEMMGRWVSAEEPGDGWTPKMWHGRTNFINIQGQTNGRFVEKADFIKLQNLVVGYTLPKQLTMRYGIERMRVFAAGSDLFMITDYTGIDPEMDRFGGVDWNGTPRQRTFTFGLNMSL
ncbi:MAG: TonB-dependent receptor [Bacteroidetes bacterium]|nr:MAG: TonB-dependent receptor [Bacteroidota bacterium]